MKDTLKLAAASGLLLALGACASRAGPNEFNVVTKAPLTVPPDYNLRPPAVGEATPGELTPDEVDRQLTYGVQIGVGASAAEQVMIARSEAIAVSPSIRALIDFEESGVLRKTPAVSDRVLEWQGTEAERAQAESDNATGGKKVLVEKRGGSRLKLPGT
ncbi:MAG: DUF3035 domain-containing protein [Pseudomonadota bacterium]